MCVVIVIELITIGTVHSDIWYLRLSDRAVAKLSSAGLWLNASKPESVLEATILLFPHRRSTSWNRALGPGNRIRRTTAAAAEKAVAVSSAHCNP